MGYGKSLIAQGQVGAAIFVLEPLAKVKDASAGDSRDLREGITFRESSERCRATGLAIVSRQNPSRQQEVADLVGLLVDAQQDAEAVALARKLEHFQHNRGDRRAFVAMMQDVIAKHRGSPDLAGVHERVVQCLQS